MLFSGKNFSSGQETWPFIDTIDKEVEMLTTNT